MKERSVITILADTCLIVSILGFVFIGYPIAAVYLLPPKELHRNDLQAKKGYFLYIPKIRAASAIIMNVDPWDEAVYKEALKRGVAQAAGTAAPGDNGTAFLFAHSSGAPWELTHTNTLFLRLGELQKGDKIITTKNGKEMYFTVYDKREIWPSETKYLESSLINYENKNRKKEIILQTCTPIGTSMKRLLIFAQQS